MGKQTYYKAVTEEFPGGLICTRKADALYHTQDVRDCGEKGAYVRAIKMTEKEFNEGEEI